jgi:hypothetical protein
MLAGGLALALATPAYAGDPQKFGDEAKATAFCKQGNVVWFNPDSKSTLNQPCGFMGTRSRTALRADVCREIGLPSE